MQCFPFDPLAFTEGFCGAVNQGIAAGCLVLTTPKDALPSLYGGSCFWMGKSTTDLDFSDYLARRVVEGLRGELPKQADILADAMKNAGRYTWDNAAQEAEAVCEGRNWFEGPP